MRTEVEEDEIVVRGGTDEKDDIMGELEEYTESCWIAADKKDGEIRFYVKPQDKGEIEKLGKEISERFGNG